AIIWEQNIDNVDVEANKFLSEEHELHTVEDVLQGANDIIAEWISDDPKFRDHIREITWKIGVVKTSLKSDELDEKWIYKMYYEYEESIRTLVSHRILAINRGEKEEVLSVSVLGPTEKIIAYLEKEIIKSNTDERTKTILQAAIEDSYQRLIEPSVE